MSSATGKPPAPNNTPGTRGSASLATSPRVSRSPAHTAAASTNGLARSRSIRGSTGTPMSARSAAKQPGGTLSHLSGNNVSSTSDDADEEDSKAETVALIDELKARLQKAENASEEYLRQH